MIGGIGMSVAMGFAGIDGMLRRTLYPDDPSYLGEMSLAAIFGAVLATGYLAMMYNLVSSIGLRPLAALFVRERGRLGGSRTVAAEVARS